jgi:hypothetical protein
MTQLMVDRGTTPVSAGAAPARVDPERRSPTRPMRPRRAGRGAGRTAVPMLRPAELRHAPGAARRPPSQTRACVLPSPPTTRAPVASAATAWRLTDRGVALVLVIGLMIMVAALTVVGLTAVTVTDEGYRATVSAALPR